MSKKPEKKARSQPNKGLLSVQERCQVGRRPQQAVQPGSRSRDLSLREFHLPPLPHLESAQASGSRRAQADRPELRQAVPRSSHSGVGRQTLPALPPLLQQAMPLTAAPQNAATAQGQLPTLSTLPATASRSSPRGRAGAVGATSGGLPVLSVQGNPQHHDTAARAEGWQADLCVPAPPFEAAKKTPKSLRLAYRRRPIATSPGPCQKPAWPTQRAPTRTVRTPAQTTQVPAPKAGKHPKDETRPAASAQEGTRDADRVSASRSLTAEQAADDGAKAAGTSQAMLATKDTEERPRSVKRWGICLPCCLCCSTGSVQMDEQKERKGTAERDAERDAVVVAAKDPVSTSFGEAEAQPPASPVPGKLQHGVDRLELRDASTRSRAPGEGTQPLPSGGPFLHVPVPPLKPAHPSRKFLNLAYQRSPVATRPGPWQKPAGPRQRAPSSTVRAPAQTTQVPAPKAGKHPKGEIRPAASAQEDTRDADRVSMSCSLAAEQAADDGAKAAGTSQTMLGARIAEERAGSGRSGAVFLPYCLCCSTCRDVLMDEQEEGEDSTVGEAAKGPASTPSGQAQSLPPASALSAGPRREGQFVPTHALLPKDDLCWDTESFFLRDHWVDKPE
ncbi:proteoglycan 4-like isoform X2 [Meleagris gallopavo]|uniref:proteoglycan 4-like isoform X2 n=1 Tax=Meleagris gallopavo TaxID=9103 RepID=UPI00093C0BFC|nr:proteoglycan 4-like isoform X2 [Meleagris gallopavo]